MPCKILIVEDNEKNRKLFRDILKYSGYEVLEARDGAEGIKTAVEQKPDLILMDIQMPVMDGFEALKALRNMPETGKIKVIALTSFAMASDRNKIFNAGFDDYISKPVDTRELPVRVKKLIGRASINGQERED